MADIESTTSGWNGGRIALLWLQSILPQQKNWALNALEVLVRLLVFLLAVGMAGFAGFLADEGTDISYLCADVNRYNMLAMALSMVIRSKRLLGLTVAIFFYDWLLLEGHRSQITYTTYKMLIIVGIVLLSLGLLGY